MNCSLQKTLMEYHTLAYFYHWSDYELRHLPRTRREMYVEQVRRQIKAENGENNKPLDGNPTSPPKYKESRY